MNPRSIRLAVRQRYAQRAQGASCCGGDKPARVVASYNPHEVQKVPAEVLAAAAGCGNPTAIGALHPGEVVLDLGSGGGIDCFLAAFQVGRAGRVIGVDMTPEMVALAERNRKRLALAQVAFVQGVLEALPLASASVDVIISNCVINLCPDKGAVFREMARVLRPGGRAYISDMVAWQALPEAVRHDLASWSACIAGAEPAERYLALMEEAGLRVHRAEPKGTAAAECTGEEGSPVFSLEVEARKERP
ncbi:MAG: arsenite methyltransferase [Dehalococcoidia bacterium]